jgi:DNA-directed RNA polymerase specialized sigma24 family protein
MAEVLGLPLGTLKSRLFRARLALRDELKNYMKK